jgi:hypothetical protein
MSDIKIPGDSNILGDSNRKSRFDPNLADEVNRLAEIESSREMKAEKVKDNNSSDFNNLAASEEDYVNDSYSIIKGKTYSGAVRGLRDLLNDEPNGHPYMTIGGSIKIYHQLTFRQNILARVNDYETRTKRTDNERNRLFLMYLDTSSAIIYPTITSKFKISKLNEELIHIPKYDAGKYLDVNYAAFKDTEFNIWDITYNTPLKKNAFLHHKVYRMLFDDDVKLMETYWNIAYSLTKNSDMMELTIFPQSPFDRLHALSIGGTGKNFCTSGISGLNTDTRLLRIKSKEALNERK